MKMSIFAFILGLITCSSFAQTNQCIRLDQAQSILHSYLAPQVGQLLTEDFPWISDEDPALSPQDITKAVKSLKWNPKSSSYESTSIVEGYCAQAASCWGWYAVNCNGKIAPREAGED